MITGNIQIKTTDKCLLIGSYSGRWQGERETSVEEQKTGKSNRKSIIFECNTKIKASYKVKKKKKAVLKLTFFKHGPRKKEMGRLKRQILSENQIIVNFLLGLKQRLKSQNAFSK